MKIYNSKGGPKFGGLTLAHHKIIRAVNNRNFEFVEIGRTNSIADK
jgi:hypothetical protein